MWGRILLGAEPRRDGAGALATVLVSFLVGIGGARERLTAQLPSTGEEIMERVQHHYVDSGGVLLHYALLGGGTGEDAPLVVMIHGFPDFWYTWRDQMAALADAGYRVAAMDTRGYNRSEQPEAVDAYAMSLLVGDVAAVIADQGEERAIVVGHDWGGMIAWSTAMSRPDFVERVVVLNLPHPRGLSRELAENPEQRQNSQYARDFQAEGSHEALSAEGLAAWVSDPAARQRYVEAFRRSSFRSMMAYYKANYPRPPYRETSDPVVPVRVPVLQIHGLTDPYLLADGLAGTWAWIDAEYTLLTLPGVGHFVQQDASERVTRALLEWLGPPDRHRQP
ncbi:MAG: alpha/beta hydrolase [Longimicrobiales bacterium]|nr:alpha/beta hydrolase [Longimicrobiales bacterium]